MPGLALSTAVAVFLLMQSGHDSPDLYAFVKQYPTQAQVRIQIASHLLGFIHVFTLSKIINFSTRRRLTDESPVSLTQLRLWQSLSSIQVAWNLPFPHVGILFGYLFLHLLPATLWAGAIAPVPSQTTVAGTLRIPFYPPDPNQKFWNHTMGGGRAVTQNGKGVFSYSPAGALQAPIFNSASTATNATGVRVHAKIDNSFLSYVGRSYGIGASAGLEEYVLDREGPRTPLLYTYEEPGYATKVDCWRNDSSAYAIHPWANRSSFAFPDGYLACGVLPNSLYQSGTVFTDSECPGLIDGYFAEWYAVLTIGKTDEHVFALQGVSHDSRHMFAIATGNGTYSPLDKVQCEAHFVPQTFRVNVDVSSSLITVISQGNSTVDMDPSASTFGAGFGLIPQIIVGQVTYLSMGITGMYSSPMGDTFISNIQNVALERNSTVDNNSVVLDGISTVLESMIDDLLVALASAQLEIAGKNSTVEAATNVTTIVTVAAMRLGTFQYIATIATLNFLIVALYCIEFTRTRGWEKMPLFDYTDMASVIVAASRGGSQLGDAIASLHEPLGTVWTGDSGNIEGANIGMRLRLTEGMPTLILARAVSQVPDEEQPLKFGSDQQA